VPNPIRVLHIVTHMNRGGLETMIMNYYREINRDIVQFDFLEHRYGKHDFTDEITGLGGNIYQVPRMNIFSQSEYQKELRLFFMDNENYQIVHSHIDTMSAVPLMYAKKAGIRILIAHSHSSNLDHDLKYPIKILFKRKISRLATDLFACSESAGKWMFGNRKYEIFRNAIKTDDFIYDKSLSSSLKSKYGLEEQFVVGHVGSFTKPKNHAFIIDIFKEIHKINNKAILLLIGVGPLELDIVNKVKRENLVDCVKFMGLRDDVNNLMQVFDVFLFPSKYEGLPVTLIEAQSIGLPCVISDRIPEDVCITRNIFVLSLSESSFTWASKTLSVYDNFNRKNMQDEVIKAGFDIKENARWLENYYVNLIKG